MQPRQFLPFIMAFFLAGAFFFATFFAIVICPFVTREEC